MHFVSYGRVGNQPTNSSNAPCPGRTDQHAALPSLHHKISRRPRAGNYKIITVRDHSILQKSSNSCYKMRENSEEREREGERLNAETVLYD